MTLSEAIRIGARIRPQAFGTLFSVDEQASCVLGAAAEAIGALDTTVENHFVGLSARSEEAERTIQSWRWMKERMACPLCGNGWYPADWHTRDVQGVIVHLNNDHRWTREQIADWLVPIEAQHKTQPQLQPAGGTEAR